MMAVTRDPESGCLEAAASPRFPVAYAAVLPSGPGAGDLQALLC